MLKLAIKVANLISNDPQMNNDSIPCFLINVGSANHMKPTIPAQSNIEPCC